MIDGDTIKLANNSLVRLIGIDAPEKDACYYQESKDFLKNIVQNKYVRLDKDISEKDKYDRLLRYVILLPKNPANSNILITDYLVRQGFALAKSYSPDVRYRSLLNSAQEEAIKNNRGIWSACYGSPQLELDREMDIPPADSDCIIKGNVSSRTNRKTYLFPGCGNYEKTKIDPRQGDKYFCNIQEAESDGFARAPTCKQE